MVDKVGVIDIGYGNVMPLINILEYLHIDNQLISCPENIHDCDRLIIPGVGSFDNFMLSLEKNKLIDGIKQFSQSKKPILGICVGAQVLGYKSEEGHQKGLELIPMNVKHLRQITNNLKIPNIGWNNIKHTDHDLFKNVSKLARFYFSHSYYFEPLEKSNCLAYTCYDNEYCAIIASQQTIGIQFHPEKSHKHGLKIIENFCLI